MIADNARADLRSVPCTPTRKFDAFQASFGELIAANDLDDVARILFSDLDHKRIADANQLDGLR